MQEGALSACQWVKEASLKGLLLFSCSVVSDSLWPHERMSNSCPLSQWCHPAISSSVVPFSSRLQSFPALGLFQWVSSHQVAKVLELQLQHQSFQWLFRDDFLQDGLVGSPCSPRDSQEFSPTPQFKSISSSVLNLPYDPTFTSIYDTGKTAALTTWTFVGKVMSAF